MSEAAKGQGTTLSSAIESRLGTFADRHALSPREIEVLSLLVRGVHPKAMGSEIGCRYASVRTYLGRMYRKLGCSGACELVLRFFEHASL